MTFSKQLLVVYLKVTDAFAPHESDPIGKAMGGGGTATPSAFGHWASSSIQQTWHWGPLLPAGR